jgi:hypothetical protein
MSTGDFAQGTLEIATIDAAHVMFALTGTKPIDFGSTASASGVYDAIRCP